MANAVMSVAERALAVAAIRQAPEFAVFEGVAVELAPQAFAAPGLLGFWLRLALEQAWLTARGVTPPRARMAAARVTAQFILADAAQLDARAKAALPAWVPMMAREVPPRAAMLAQYFDAAPEDFAVILRAWTRLGTAEALMETGGDIRLARDPVTSLNGYGCSHRPRPWAVTFASSTASSSSERGYLAADEARLRVTAQMLKNAAPRLAVRRCLAAVRRGIASALKLPEGAAVILAASGTDTELLGLAVSHLAAGEQPVTNILIAPEETGRGVPMAARGLHFAVDTARGHDVTRASAIPGFRADTKLANVMLRQADGTLRSVSEVEVEISQIMASAIAAGRRVILHGLDLSKTGLLAPSMAYFAHLRAEYGEAFDIVIDACQVRLSPASIQAYMALDAMVLITGSKFFTGPPFAGAALLPAHLARRLNGPKRLAEGLQAYLGRDDFPFGCAAAADLAAEGNYGLGLRWHAALAEMRAVLRIAPARRAAILDGFGEAVRAAIMRQPGLKLLEAPPIARHEAEEPWERCQTIFSFALRLPGTTDCWLTPDEARLVYQWLNMDLSPFLPEGAQKIAARICHIGQPVPLPAPNGREMLGALRVSAGARLISGEPSHQGLGRAARLKREFHDLGIVFEKIGLILGAWDVLAAARPTAHYRPAGNFLTGAARSVPVT